MAVEVDLLRPSPWFDPVSRVLCQFAPTWVPLGCHWVAIGNPMANRWQRTKSPQWQKMGFQLVITG